MLSRKIAPFLVCWLVGCSLTSTFQRSSPAPSPTTSPAPTAATPAPTAATPPTPGVARRTDGKVDAAPEQWRAFKALLDKHRVVTNRLAELEGEHPFSAMPMDAAKAVAVLESLRGPIEAFGELRDAACGTYRDLYLMDLKPHEEPRWICEHAKRTDDLIPVMARYALATLARVEGGKLIGPLGVLRTGYPVSDQALEQLAPAKLAEARARAIASLQPLVPLAGDSASLDTLLPDRSKELIEALAAAPAAGDKFKYAHRAPAAVAKVATELFAKTKYRYARPKISGVLARGTDWDVTRAARSQIPVRRTHRVQVLIQVKDESFCRMYEVDVSEAYMGGGTWGQPSTAGTETGPRIITCARP